MGQQRNLDELLVEQQQAWLSKRRKSVEEIVEANDLGERPEVILDLIYNEILLREDDGEEPTEAEYAERFPALVDAITRQFQVHRALTPAPTRTPGPGEALTSNDERSPNAIGRIEIPGFELLEVAGRGGNAVAYRAMDLQLNRIVAIKLLSAVNETDADRRKDLLREAESAAALEHPSIVRIHQIGETDGVPFLVMEFIEGGSLVDRLQQGPMPAAEAAQVALQVTQAIQHAHAHGTIHRDLKPGNILLDKSGKPYVCDFGLAKQLDPEETRQTTNLVGTPAYMSPEQAQGEQADERSDIYSLGATLYEMLGGRSPFQAASVWDTLYQVMTSDPISVRQLNSAVPRDLETICAKCLEKRPDKRYATAADLAHDLQCFIENRPISARPVSQVEMFQRWCGRNKALAGSLFFGAALALTLLVGSVIAAITFRDQNERLASTLQSSIDAADQLLVSVTEDTELLPKTPGSQEVSKKLLQRAREYYESFLSDNEGNTQLAFQLARTRAGLAAIAYRLDDLETVRVETTAGLALLESLPRSRQRDIDLVLLRSRLHHNLGSTLHGRRETEEAIPILERARDTCAPAIKANPEHTALLTRHARILSDLANCHQSLGDPEKSKALLLEAGAAFSKLLRDDPDNLQLTLNAAKVEHNLGNTRRAEGLEVSVKHYRNSIDLLTRLPRDAQESVAVRTQLAATNMNLGMTKTQTGDIDGSDAAYSFAIRELKRLVELEPIVTRHKWLYSVAVLNSGNVDNQLGNFDRLASRCAEVIPVLDELIESEPENMNYVEVKAMLQANIAQAESELGRPEKAIEPLTGSIATFQKVAEASGDSPDAIYSLALSQYQLAQALMLLERFDDAAEATKQSSATVVRGLKIDPTHQDLRIHDVDLIIQRADNLLARDPVDYSEAEKAVEAGLEKAAVLAEEIDNVAVTLSYNNLKLMRGDIYRSKRKFADALSEAKGVIKEVTDHFAGSDLAQASEVLGDAQVLIARTLKDQIAEEPTAADRKSLVRQLEAAIDRAEALKVEATVIEELRNDATGP